MGRYYNIQEYSCPADYYEAGGLGSVSPRDIEDRRNRANEKSRREQEAVDRKTWGMGVNE